MQHLAAPIRTEEDATAVVLALGTIIDERLAANESKAKIALDLLRWKRGRSREEMLLFKAAVETAVAGDDIVGLMRGMKIY